MPIRRHGPPVPEIDVSAIASNPSSPSHPTSTVPPAEESQITKNRKPTPKSDRLLVRTKESEMYSYLHVEGTSSKNISTSVDGKESRG